MAIPTLNMNNIDNDDTNRPYCFTPVRIYCHAKESQIGEVRYDINGGEPCIAVRKYGAITWEPLAMLSGANWVSNRRTITKNIQKIMQSAKAYESLQGELTVQDEALDMLKDLFASLSPEKKKEFLIKHKNTFMGRQTCFGCLKYCPEKKKCASQQCHGLCESCLVEIGDTCPACNAKQEIDCVICMDTKNINEVCRSNCCSHAVCWKCYGQAFQAGRPILQCPYRCQGSFTKETEVSRAAGRAVARQLDFGIYRDEDEDYSDDDMSEQSDMDDMPDLIDNEETDDITTEEAIQIIGLMDDNNGTVMVEVHQDANSEMVVNSQQMDFANIF